MYVNNYCSNYTNPLNSINYCIQYIYCILYSFFHIMSPYLLLLLSILPYASHFKLIAIAKSKFPSFKTSRSHSHFLNREIQF